MRAGARLPLVVVRLLSRLQDEIAGRGWRNACVVAASGVPEELGGIQKCACQKSGANPVLDRTVNKPFFCPLRYCEGILQSRSEILTLAVRVLGKGIINNGYLARVHFPAKPAKRSRAARTSCFDAFHAPCLPGWTCRNTCGRFDVAARSQKSERQRVITGVKRE